MVRTNVGCGGRGGRGLSDRAVARGCGQKSIRTNTSGTRSEINATISSDTGVQEPVREDEPNTSVSQRRRGSNIIEQVPHDPSKRTMTGDSTDPKVSRKINSILKTMFNGSEQRSRAPFVRLAPFFIAGKKRHRSHSSKIT
ncbi:hypothetical protein Tco_0169732 [Tanacetum coccineum]